ncbi:MAG: hypothetical protein HKN27_01675 [Silicimonas sp.]|nr:hypothetical protein [Silicimonas sp.]
MFSISKKVSKKPDFLKNESGSLTIESVLWLPVFFFFFTVLADASMIFSGQSLAMRALQDESRRMATGLTPSTNELERRLQARLSSLSPNAQVAASVSNGIVTTTVVMPASDLDVAGIVGAFENAAVSIQTDYLLEDLS